VVPDIAAGPVEMNPLRNVLEASGSFTTFATEYIRDHKITPDWQVTPQLVDQFHGWLAEHRIQPGVAEWSANREFVESRLKTEIFNLSLGVDKGDEVEAQIDPPIQRAVEAVLKSR
jgi:carboxyl-terminal processing protease